jgi:hypothetical protein
MAEATLARVGLWGLVPSGVGPRPAVALERALGEPFAGALASAFDALEELDPGAVWVLRRLDVRLAVPASEPDPARQSARVAAGIAAAVARVVAAGPSGEAVRFTSRAAYVAAYVRARLAGVGPGWVFERFETIGALATADAVAAASRIADVDLVDVVADLVAAGGWTRLVTTATEAEAVRLVRALERRVAGVSPGPDALAVVSRARADRAAANGAASWWDRTTSPAARLVLLGVAGERVGVSASLVAAVWRLEPDAAARLAAPAKEVDAVGADDPTARPQAAPAGARAADTAGGVPHTGVYAAAGAPAFALLPDLMELLDDDALRAGSRAAAAVRALVLRGAFGGALDTDDPAVALASGLTGPAEGAEVDALLAGPVAAWAERLASDPVLGWRHAGDAAWVADAAARHPALGVVAAALLRRFARHLPGFGRSGAAHLIPQVLPLGGVVRVTDELIDVALPTGPLHVLLAMAGLDAFACRPSWLVARVVVTHEVAP